jgi:phosphoserine phosphatase
MNLVLSGPIDDDLRRAVAQLARPRNVVALHARADRFEVVEDGPPTRARIAALCDAARVDHAYIEEGKRFSDFKLLAMDMDSTLITIECIDEIADFAGKKKEVSAITEAAMRGEIPDFAESLRRRVALLAGTSVDVLEQVFDERLKLSEGAEQLLDAAKREGIYTLLLSGGFTYFTERLREQLSLTAAYANTLETERGRLTGRVREPILDAAEKARHVRDAMHQLQCDPTEALVVGDGANDIPMMREVTYSVAFHAKPATAKIARIGINYGRLDTILDNFEPRA